MEEEKKDKITVDKNINPEEYKFLREEYYKRYGIIHQGLLYFRKITEKFGLSLEEIFYLFKKK